MALFSICVAGVALSRPAAGQFGLPGILGGAKNVAVQQALSQFGKSLGAQLPIVVADDDAYPTIPNLPGAPFKGSAPPPNLAALLRASSDGTVALRPGDYAINVAVFCMRISAHSPPAHRYVVAELKGSAADIVRTLNARAPSYPLNHFALQVLSWNIQAGLPYGSMQPAQRAIVDRVIPEFRGRLSGDLYESSRAKYESIAGEVPGMPSFEDALTRLGPPGQALIAMQSYRQQLAQPPASPAQLLRMLVPQGPPLPGTDRSVQGSTPWSRYSDRVYVRFTTGGGYLDPGTYQVRVLPATVSVAGTSYVPWRRVAQATSANVPLANVVNNPGTGSVQPLTQAPQSGPPPDTPPPTPSPTPSASITSQTVVTAPEDRSRTTIGVAEQVSLTFSGGDAKWSLSGNSGKLSYPTGKTNFLTAGPKGGSDTITATDTATNESASISFTVIPPSGIFNERVPGSLLHYQTWPNSGFEMHVYLQPDSVSFSGVTYLEKNVCSTASGVYAFENHVGHVPNADPAPVGDDEPGKGSLVMAEPGLDGPDEAYSGLDYSNPPYAPGSVEWDIPIGYEVPPGTTFYPIGSGIVKQISTLGADGSTLTTTKGNESVTTTVGAPTSGFPSTPSHGASHPPLPAPNPC